jgi:membrane fusion protein (multidrug efflux system)
MKKRLFIALIVVLVIGGTLAGIKALQIRKMVDHSAGFSPPPTPVTASEVMADSWETLLTTVGSLAAVQGVNVSAELAGKVVQIAFEPGATVADGDLLLRQDTSAEEALLAGAEASVTLTRTNLDRARELVVINAISQNETDQALADFQQAVSEAENLRATIAKKNIRAPFGGKLGIRLVNLGQILNPGDAIVNLQALDPIFIDFTLPQRHFKQLQTGLPLRVVSSAIPGKVMAGRITTVNPALDQETRNLRIQGTLSNPGEQLRPGMFADVSVVLPQPKEVLIVPITAVLYAPFGDSVFVIEDAEPDQQQAGGASEKSRILRQQFVRLGEKRGDFVEILSGLEAGESVVTTGVFKLRNQQTVTIDNTLQPDFKLHPEPEQK